MLKNFMAALSAFVIIHVGAAAQTDDRMGAILYLCGAESEEELDEQEVERFSGFLSRPLEINIASRSRLLSSGLMSQYQVASLCDYRSRSGDILSVAELALVDGFGSGYANALKAFISFRSNRLPGLADGPARKTCHEALARSAVKGGDFLYGTKYRIERADRLALSMAARTKYTDRDLFPPSEWSMSIVYYGRKKVGKVLLGDFNARFGQGLALWSGMSVSGLSSSSSFARRPSGLSPSWSWSGTGSHRGVAAGFLFGKTVVSSFLSFPGLRRWCEGGKSPEISAMAGANIARFTRNGQFSVTGYCKTEPKGFFSKPESGRLSGDFRYSWRGVDCFGEAAWDFAGRSPGLVIGTVFPLGKDWKFSSVVHSYASGFPADFSGGVRSWTKTKDERGILLCLEKGPVFLTVDLARKDSDKDKKQLKALFKMPLQLTSTSVLSFRVNERFRPYEAVLKYRTGARCDFDWSSSGLSVRYGASDKPAWKIRARVEGILCRSLSGLSYLEGGRKTDWFSAYMRGTIFIVDNWDDRIYSYERDAPGSFTVPAYYGRGWSFSAVAGGKFRFGNRKTKILRTHLRASAVGYSFMRVPKPLSWELKIQASLSI